MTVPAAFPRDRCGASIHSSSRNSSQIRTGIFRLSAASSRCYHICHRVSGVNLIREEESCHFYSGPDRPAVLGAAPPTRSLFLTVCAGTCTRVAGWRSHFFSICGTGDALPVCPCRQQHPPTPPCPGQFAGVSSRLLKRLSKVSSYDGAIVEELQFLTRLHGEASGQVKRRERSIVTT